MINSLKRMPGQSCLVRLIPLTGVLISRTVATSSTSSPTTSPVVIVTPSQPLIIVSYLCVSFSFGFVLITMLSILVNKDLRHQLRFQILLNSCTCFLLLLCMLMILTQSDSHISCMTMAYLLTALFISYFLWMSIEAVNLYRKFLRALHQTHEGDSRRLVYRMLIGWGLPFIYSTVLFADQNNVKIRYDFVQWGGPQYCFVDVKTRLGYMFLPMGFAMLFNFSIFVLVARQMYTHKKTDSSQLQSAVYGIKVAGCLSAVLGTTWVLAFAFIGAKSVKDENAIMVMNYVMLICILLQGFLVFYFHCFRNDKVNLKVKLWCSLIKPRRSSLAAVRTSRSRDTTPIYTGTSSRTYTSSQLATRIIPVHVPNGNIDTHTAIDEQPPRFIVNNHLERNSDSKPTITAPPTVSTTIAMEFHKPGHDDTSESLALQKVVYVVNCASHV
eukprot:m.156843 g.156843  ORF g.156843 m.156843 type:complete len:441 (+) comp31029_c0_seq3:188-1510(+)